MKPWLDILESNRRAPKECKVPTLYGALTCRHCPLVDSCRQAGAEKDLLGRVRLAEDRSPIPPGVIVAGDKSTTTLPPVWGSAEAPARARPSQRSLPAPIGDGAQETVLVIDVSGSMLANDFPPTRLAAR